MKSKGVTLIEILVAVAMFGIIVGAISGLFISGIRTQRRVLATQELLDQTSYIMEYMGRALRMARKELNCTDKTDPTTCACLNSLTSGYGYNYELTPGGIRFIDYNGICTEFFLDTTTNQLKKSVGASTWELTSDKLQVNSFNINLLGAVQPPADYLQPRVTIFLEILGREAVGRPKTQIQTSISQRTLDVQY